jgi:hypothetical protein
MAYRLLFNYMIHVFKSKNFTMNGTNKKLTEFEDANNRAMG